MVDEFPFVSQKQNLMLCPKHSINSQAAIQVAPRKRSAFQKIRHFCRLSNIGVKLLTPSAKDLADQSGAGERERRGEKQQGTNAILTSNMHCSNHGNSGRSKAWVCAFQLWESVCVSLYVCVGGYSHKTNNRHYYYFISSVYVCGSSHSPELCNNPAITLQVTVILSSKNNILIDIQILG